MVGPFRRWRLNRKTRHWHEWGGGYTHSHSWHDLDHGHEFDEVCRRVECRDFQLHRAHPRGVK